jgi:hypothetical protein
MWTPGGNRSLSSFPTTQPIRHRFALDKLKAMVARGGKVAARRLLSERHAGLD